MPIEGPDGLASLNCTITDCDFHTTERLTDLLDYIESPYDRLLSSVEGGYFGYEPNPFPDAGLIATRAASGRVQRSEEDEMHSTEDVVRGRDVVGDDRPIVTPGFVILKLAMVPDADVAAALAKACTLFYLDSVLDPSQDVYGTLTVAGQNPEAGAEIIETHARSPGIVGVSMPTGGLNPPLGHELYEPIYESCEAAGLPLMMHNIGTGPMKSFPIQYDWFSTDFESHTIAHHFQHTVNIVNMLVEGVPVRFPDLDFVFQEAGIGWIPHLMRRLDHEYFAQPEAAPLLDRPPERLHARTILLYESTGGGDRTQSGIRRAGRQVDGG